MAFAGIELGTCRMTAQEQYRYATVPTKTNVTTKGLQKRARLQLLRYNSKYL